MKVATILGARPQFIKAAVLSRLIRSHPGIEEMIVHTGQHYDENMSEVFFRELELPMPACNLSVGSNLHGAQTGQMLQGLEKFFLERKPDWVLVFGDTNSTLAGALSAAKLKIPVAHVEAGLRAYDEHMPEEINRVLTDHLSALLFAPSEVAVQNLRREGIDEHRIRLVGDVMYDASLYFGAKAEAESDVLRKWQLKRGHYLLATIHRASNTDDRVHLRAITQALVEVSRELPVVMPLHPRTRKAMETHGLFEHASSRITFLEPVGYLDMLMLQRNCRLVITDSGGLQKEAFYNGVPCVTLRHTTEWVELIDLGGNRLVPPGDSATIVSEILDAADSPGIDNESPYGDGSSCKSIVEALLDAHCRKQQPSAPEIESVPLTIRVARSGKDIGEGHKLTHPRSSGRVDRSSRL